MLSTVHSLRLPQAAILFSRVANITSITNIPSTNGAKNIFLEGLLASNMVHSKDNGIA